MNSIEYSTDIEKLKQLEELARFFKDKKVIDVKNRRVYFNIELSKGIQYYLDQEEKDYLENNKS